MSPRKSSTSSAKPLSPRPRYLGIEVAGVLSPPRRWIEQELARLLAGAAADQHERRIRIIRWEGPRGVVEIEHRDLPLARQAWNQDGPGPGPDAVHWRTVRAWGTLRGSKRWLDQAVRSPPA